MSEQVFLAVDLGASSGRVVAASFTGRLLRLNEVHRFENGPVRLGDSRQWDFLALWRELLGGMCLAAARFGHQVASIGVDTWGVDFGLLGTDGTLLGNPYHYRDPRTAGMPQAAFPIVSREEIFRRTGLQFLPFNTLFQLLAMRRQGSPLLDIADRLLLMPDLFHWLLSGEKANERTNASTTQFYDPTTRDWAVGLLRRFDLPVHPLGKIVEPATTLGPLLNWVASETGLADTKVIVPATHDTASAVVAVPAEATATDWCYISSGTWSLLGTELAEPVLTDLCRDLNFTNETGVGGKIRLLKNIAGLWLVQELRRIWASQGRSHNWEQLSRLAASAKPLAALVDPDHESLLAPADMATAIREYCRQSEQSVPDGEGALVRCALESLALKYRFVLESLEQVIGRRLNTIHIIGGGTQNKLLCQYTANACGRRVRAGPVEATAAGNALVQAMACGAIGGIADARAVVRDSFRVDEYLPQDSAQWESAFARFVSLLSAGGKG